MHSILSPILTLLWLCLAVGALWVWGGKKKAPKPRKLKNSKTKKLKNSQPKELKNSQPKELKNSQPKELKNSQPKELKNSQPKELKRLAASERDPRAVALRAMLEELYAPLRPFRLSVQDRRPKTRAGIYSPRFARITIYAGHGHIEEVAIHEYAHHIVITELHGAGALRSHHARGFKTVYSVLIDAYNASHTPLQPDARYYLARGKRMRIFEL